MPVHSHGDATHDHADAAPGHTHDAAGTEPDTVPAVVDAGPAPGGLAIRVLLTLASAAGMIVGAFLTWLTRGDSRIGTEIAWPALLLGDSGSAGLFRSAGLVVIVIGLLAVLGLALRRGWLTVLAGLLGIAAFVLILIQEYRAGGGINTLGPGIWLVLAGGVAALLGGFFASRSRVVATTRRA